MILAIDIGNSNMTLGLYHPEGKMQFRSVLKTERYGTRDQFAIDLLGVFQLYGASVRDVKGAVLASVVPSVTAAVSGAVLKLTGRTPMLVGPGIKTGLNIRGETHNQLGADIVASSVAALQKYPSPLIVIDIGTATTMSVLRGYTFEGCAIIPGIQTAVEALSSRAAELPHISLEAPASILGRNTIDAMRAGALYGHAAMLDEMIVRMEEAADISATVVITGNGASTIRKYCRREILYDANLQLDGLFFLFQKNQVHRRKGETQS